MLYLKYYDFNGNEQDPLKTFADSGINYIRFRVWNSFPVSQAELSDICVHDTSNSYFSDCTDGVSSMRMIL